MLLNVDIVDIEKANEICSPSFFVDELSGLFVHHLFLHQLLFFHLSKI